MIDPYEPALADLAWSQEECETIEIAISHGKPWDHDAKPLEHIRDKLINLKGKIRTHHLMRQDQTCCYCRTILAGTGRFMIDREHILPKSKFPKLAYTLSNLSVCCKRCNMQFKGEDADFVIDQENIEINHENGAFYLFIHPNFDEWSKFLFRCTVQVNTSYLVSYNIVSDDPKASYTYEYFKLKELEVDSFDHAQGAMPLGEIEQEIMKRLNQKIRAN